MIDERASPWLVINFEGHLMKQDRGSGADQAKTGKAGAKTGAMPAPTREARGLARHTDERRLQKAAGDVKEILRNSRH